MSQPTCDLCAAPPIMFLSVHVHDRWWSRWLPKLPRQIKRVNTCQEHIPQNLARVTSSIRRRTDR